MVKYSKLITAAFLFCFQAYSLSAQLNPYFITFLDSGMVCSGVGVFPLPSGNLLYAGYAYSSSNNSAIILKKLQADGSEIWSTAFTTTNGQYALNKAFYDNNAHHIYLTGYLSQSGQTDGLVMIADTQGVLLGNYLFGQGNASESFNGICKTSDGGFAAFGYQGFTGSNSNFYLIKVDASGMLQWEQTYGTPLIDVGMNIIQTADNGYLLSGDAQTSFNSFYNVRIIKTDSSGMEEWSLPVTSPFNSGCRDMITDAYGHFIITGETATPTSAYFDVMMIKFDINGNLIWNKTIPATDQGDAGFSIAEFSPGHYLLTGYHFIASNNNTSIFMAHTDTAGNVMDFRTYDSIPMIDIGYHIAPVSNGYYIAGSSIWLENKYALVFDTLSVISGIHENPIVHFSIWPNPLPAGSLLRINNTFGFNIISISDLSGKTIIRQNLSAGFNTVFISGKIPAGVYLVKMENQHHSFSRKLIVTSITQ